MDAGMKRENKWERSDFGLFANVEGMVFIRHVV